MFAMQHPFPSAQALAKNIKEEICRSTLHSRNFVKDFLRFIRSDENESCGTLFLCTTHQNVQYPNRIHISQFQLHLIFCLYLEKFQEFLNAHFLICISENHEKILF